MNEQQTQTQQYNEQAEDDLLGFNKKSGERRIYFEIFDGGICRRSKEMKDGWEGPIKTINPQTKEEVFSYVERYDNIVAYVIDINKFKKTFESGGTQAGLELLLKAGENTAVLRFVWPDSTLIRFLKVARNIDFNQPLYISVFPTYNQGTHKKGVGIAFKQGTGPNPTQWPNVEEYYSKAHPNGMPQGVPPQEDDFDSKWDFKERDKFLMNEFAVHVLPIVKQIAVANGVPQKNEQQQPAQQQSSPLKEYIQQHREQVPVSAQPQYPTQALQPNAPAVPNMQYQQQPPVQQGFGQVVQPPVQQQSPLDDFEIPGTPATNKKDDDIPF